MVEPVSLSFINYFMPIIAFVLVSIIIFTALQKTIFGKGKEMMAAFVAMLMASFFILQTTLVDFVRITTGWISTILVLVFFVVLIFSFFPWEKPFEMLTKGNWFAWIILGLTFGIFIVSSAYVFNWVFSWATVREWAQTEWFGMVLLILTAALVAWRIGGSATGAAPTKK